MKDVLKFEYKRIYFDLVEMKPGAKEIYEIVCDGSIVKKSYKAQNRKIQSLTKAKFPLDEFGDLSDKICECIYNADRLDFYVDDSEEELKIFHKYGRIQRMDRGLGNESSNIGEIVNSFLERYIPEQD